MDDCYKKGQDGNTVFCCIHQRRHSSWIWQQSGYTELELPVLSMFAVCQALSAEYTPGCLLTQWSGICSHNALCVRVCASRTNLCEQVWFWDNSLCICLCIIVVLLATLTTWCWCSRVWWGLLLVVFVQLSRSACSCTPVCCLLRCGSVVSSATWLKDALSGQRIQWYHVCWRPTAEESTQEEHLVCVISCHHHFVWLNPSKAQPPF